MSKVVVRSTAERPLDQAVESLLQALAWEEIIQPDARVVIKLNLNTADADKVASANTSPALVEALCKALLTRTRNITLVEAQAYRNPAEEAARVTGIFDITERLGIPFVNLSKASCRDAGIKELGPLPEILLDADVFITMPVVKTHALTSFTGSLKNQWGCVPRYDRIAFHYALDYFLVELQRVLRPRLCIMDGIIGVEGRGPTNGDPRRLDIILGSTDAVALDATAARLVGLDPTKARHVVMAHEAGLGEFAEEKIRVDMDLKPNWAPFVPAKLDWALVLMNRWSRYRWFRRHILEVEPIFRAGKTVVNLLRRVGIVR